MIEFNDRRVGSHSVTYLGGYSHIHEDIKAKPKVNPSSPPKSPPSGGKGGGGSKKTDITNNGKHPEGWQHLPTEHPYHK